MKAKEIKYTSVKLNPMSKEYQEAVQNEWHRKREPQLNEIHEHLESGFHPHYYGTIRNNGSTRIDLISPGIVQLPYHALPSIPYIAANARKDNERVVANFFIRIICQECVYSSEDKEGEKYVVLEMALKDDSDSDPLPLRVKLEDYQNISQKIGAKYPHLQIFDYACFNDDMRFKYAELMKKKELLIDIYRFGGWYMKNNKLIFLNAAMPNVSSKYLLKGSIELAKQFLPLYWQTAVDKAKLTILLVAVCWAPLDKLFECAGMTLKGFRSMLYVSAPTGTGKTTLTTIFSKAFLKDGESSCLRFEDTMASLEEAIVTRKDVPLIIDDFFAQGTRQGDATYEHKASAISRIAGDKLVKGKCGANREPMPDRKYRGTLIATGEFIKLNTHSSYLRCWQLFFPKNYIILGK